MVRFTTPKREEMIHETIHEIYDSTPSYTTFRCAFPHSILLRPHSATRRPFHTSSDRPANASTKFLIPAHQTSLPLRCFKSACFNMSCALTHANALP